MTIANKLTYLNDTKGLLREAINRAGHYLDPAAPFRDYPYQLLKGEYSLKLDFMREQYVAKSHVDGSITRIGFSSIINFTRSSGGGRFNHLGVYEWVAANTPRIDYDPATLSMSDSSLALGAGLKTFTVTRQYTVGHYVRATADETHWMAGRVLSSSATSVTLWIDKVVGSGTFSSWTLIRKLGLLVEESRTNLFGYSCQPEHSSWSKAGSPTVTVTDKTGLLSDYPLRLFKRTVTGPSYLARAVTKSAAAAVYTLTAVVERGTGSHVPLRIQGAWPARADVVFNLDTATFSNLVATGAFTGLSASIKGLGLDRYLLTLTATTDTAASVAGYISAVSWVRYVDGTDAVEDSSVYIGYMGLEAGAFPASPIPTTDAQVTRAADVASVEDLSDWYRADEGAVVAMFGKASATPTTQTISALHNGTAANRAALMRLAANGAVGYAFNHAHDSSAAGNTGNTSAIAKAVVTWDGAVVRMSANGGVALTRPSAGTPAVTLLSIGGAGYTTSFANTHIEEIQFIPRALTAIELQRITA